MIIAVFNISDTLFLECLVYFSKLAKGEASAANICFFCLSSAGGPAASWSYTSFQLCRNAMRVQLSWVITEVLNTQQEAIKCESQFQDECWNEQVAEKTAYSFRIYLIKASEILCAITRIIYSHSNWISSVCEFEHKHCISHILEYFL